MDSTDDHFSLKWNNFRSSLTKGFHDFLQEEMMVDVTLAAEGKFLQAHKLVLSVCSPYFKNLFKVNPCRHPIVILKDVSHLELSYVLQFMYKGEVGVKHDELPSFLKLADTLKLKGLTGLKVENESANSSQVQSNVSRIKKNIIHSLDLEDNNTASESGVSRLKELRPARQRKRRLSSVLKSDVSKSSNSKKLKSAKSDTELKYQESGDDGYPANDDENDTLVELLVSKEKNSESRDTHSSRENVFESEDIDEGKSLGDDCDLPLGLFDSSTDTEQAPQELLNYRTFYPKRSTRKSYIWKYFTKYQSSATCILCGRSFRGFRPHASIEFHLKKRHPMEYQEFAHIRERQRQITEKSGVDYQMIQTKRGKDMLLYDGYTFTQNRMCKDGMRWQCSFPKCKAFCRMSSAGWLTPHKTNHEHPKPSEAEIKKRILRMELKARAQSSGATPGEIIRNALPAEEYQTTDQRACYTRCIQRFRKSLQRKHSKRLEDVWVSDNTTNNIPKDLVKPGIPSPEETTCVISKHHVKRPVLVKEGLKEEPLWTSHSEPAHVAGSEDSQEIMKQKNDLHSKIGPFGM